MAIRSHLASLVLLLPSVLAAANNWDVPCFDGKCAYDVVQTGPKGTSTGSLFISGSPKAVSDITPAAGWTILDCEADKMTQTVRAVCTGPAADCAHLYQGGAKNTIVRLPESCGKMAFARVAEEFIHEDQSVPSSIAAQLSRRAGVTSNVRGITIDTNFAAVDPAQNGNVTLFLAGALGNPGNFTVTPPSSVQGRDSSDNVVPKTLGFFSWNIDDSDTKTFNYDKQYTLFDSSISCPAAGGFPAFSGGLDVSVEGKANIAVAYGVAATGTWVPPWIDDFGLFANLDAQLDGILAINANANANIGTGTIPIYSLSLPGLDFAGILSLDADFALNAEADASLSADANVNVDLSYTVSGAKLFYPASAGSSSGGFTPPTTNLGITANPSGTASGSVNAHLTPTIGFSIDAFAGIASAEIDLTADAHGTVNLSLQGSASAGTGQATSASFSGCVDVSGGLDVGLSADADFFGLFDPSTNVNVFDKSWDIYNKCFSKSKRSPALDRSHPRDLMKRGLSCPAPAGTATTTVVSTSIPASSVKAL